MTVGDPWDVRALAAPLNGIDGREGELLWTHNCTTSRAFEQQLASIFVVSAGDRGGGVGDVLFPPTIPPPPRSPPCQQMTMATTLMAMPSFLIALNSKEKSIQVSAVL